MACAPALNPKQRAKARTPLKKLDAPPVGPRWHEYAVLQHALTSFRSPIDLLPDLYMPGREIQPGVRDSMPVNKRVFVKDFRIISDPEIQPDYGRSYEDDQGYDTIFAIDKHPGFLGKMQTIIIQSTEDGQKLIAGKVIKLSPSDFNKVASGMQTYFERAYGPISERYTQDRRFVDDIYLEFDDDKEIVMYPVGKLLEAQDA